MYIPSGGYGSCVLPAVLMLILQQALALGIGMAAGTTRERHRNGQLIPDDDPHYRGAYRIVWGKALCYGMSLSRPRLPCVQTSVPPDEEMGAAEHGRTGLGGCHSMIE